MNDILLNVQDIEVYYGKIRALKKVSLQIKKGEIVTLLGANGAGKSTTLMAITGIVKITSGHIFYKGIDLSKVRADKIVTHGISLAPEGRHIYPYLTVIENLYVGAISRKDKKEISETLSEVYELFPRLKERMNQLAGTIRREQQMPQ